MIRINETQARIAAKMLKAEEDYIQFENEDGEGVVLDSGKMSGVIPEFCNYEVYGIYSDLTADTQFGKINLKEEVKDEDDWFTIEDLVDDYMSQFK